MVITNIPVYGITAKGKKITIGTAQNSIDNAYYVGGTIFYIDDTSTGATYKFYDEEGDRIPDENITVGSKPYAYTVEGTPSKDKFYIFHDALFTSKHWTYYGAGDQPVYDSVGGTSKNFGTGRANTAAVFAKNDGIYYTASTDTHPTIWAVCKDARDDSFLGCTDWFIPSQEEADRLKQNIDNGSITSTGIVTFSGKYIWSSSEDNSDRAWCWLSSYCRYDYKGASYSCVLVRAF